MVVGDYDMKGKEPTICKKFRRIFRNTGYKTYLVNEFRTSKLYNCCDEEIEKFLLYLLYDNYETQFNQHPKYHHFINKLNNIITTTTTQQSFIIDKYTNNIILGGSILIITTISPPIATIEFKTIY